MKADGSVLIDTKIMTGGMEKGFDMIKDEMASVGIAAKKAGEKINLSFSRLDISKPIANAAARVQKLERQLVSVSEDLRLAMSDDDDKATERLLAKKIAVYDRLEEAREKLAMEIAAAAQKEAEAEEKASQRAIRASQKEAEAKQRATEKQVQAMTKPIRRFNTRMREIVTGALFFNAVSAGLRNVTTYFGTALAANEEYSNSLARLRGSLLTAFQPIYESVLPAIVSLINWLNVAAQVVGRFFAAITGKNYNQMQKNAKALNKQAGAIAGVGDAAEEAAAQLAGFDEINRMESVKNASTAGGSGSVDAGTAGEIVPQFETEEITQNLEDILELVGSIGATLLGWRIASMFTDSLSKAAGLGISVGGAFKYAYNWADAFSNGIDWENLSGMLLGATAIAAGLAIAFGTIGAAVGLLITGVGLIILALREWITTGQLTNEACAALVIGIMAVGAAISLFTGSWIPLLIAGVASAVVLIAKNWDKLVAGAKEILAKIQAYFEETFADGFINGLSTLIEDAVAVILDFFIRFVNSVIENWNKIMNSINSYQTTGTIGPQTYGATPSMAGYSRTPNVPYLAKGAVLPANKPFLAVVGDQTSGTNVEAPLSTIKQALSEVMAENGMDVNISFNGSLSELARILTPVITREQRGTSRSRG